MDKEISLKRTCSNCEYHLTGEGVCMWCGGSHKYWRPKITTEDLIYMYEIKQRAEKDYKDALFVYANYPVNTAGRNEAYSRIWILSNILGYKGDEVEKDMQEAEQELSDLDEYFLYADDYNGE